VKNERERLKATIGTPDIDKADYELREPTEEELNELIQYKIEDFNLSYEEAKEHVEYSYYAVFPDYLTGGPCYAGRILIEIGDAAPEFLRIYTWDGGKIREREQAPEMRM
jgi:hypothetical protein